MLRISWTWHVRTKEALKKTETKRTRVHRNSSYHFLILRQIMRKESQENLTVKGHTESENDKEKQRVIYLRSLGKLMSEELGGTVKRQTLLIAAKDRKSWRVMIAHVIN